MRAKPQRLRIAGCAIDRVTLSEAAQICESAIRTRSPIQHMSINVAKLVALQDDADLRHAVDACELVTADGQPIVWASWLVGNRLPERVTGIDLMYSLIRLCTRHGFSIYVIGARPSVLEQAMANLAATYPTLSIGGYRDGYFTDDEEEDVVAAIAEARPDILFVAMSSPKKEFFIARVRAVLDIPVVMGVGGAIDVVAGMTKRAPSVMQRWGLEWLYRLLQEPRRLFMRYAVSNVKFVRLMTTEIVTRRSQQSLGAAGLRG